MTTLNTQKFNRNKTAKKSAAVPISSVENNGIYEQK